MVLTRPARERIDQSLEAYDRGVVGVRERELAERQAFEDVQEILFRQCAYLPGDLAVVVDENVGRLGGDPKRSPHLEFGVGDVFKTVEPEVCNELCHGSLIVLACHTDEADVVAEFLLSLCDRRGDTFAMWSPGSPEPENRVLSEQVGNVQLAAVECVHYKAGSLLVALRRLPGLRS
jgi:hypothetical protein